MAPRKESKEKSDTAAADLILTYLRKQNRPYSATDISANLHNKVTKTAAAKLLKDLHERKEIEGRAAGKQIVYHALQTSTDASQPTALTSLETQTTTLRSTTATLQSEHKTLKSHLSALTSTLSTAALASSLSTLSAQKTTLQTRLEPLRSGTVRPVDAAELKAVDADVKKWEGIEARRRKVEREVWVLTRDALPEGENVGELREKLGLDE